MLAHRVRIYLPICGHVAHGPIIPIKAELPKPDDEVTILNRYYNEQ
jgi:hypothetical protein